MSNSAETVQNRSRVPAALPLAAFLYLFFAFSYMWYLPNYHLLRLGGTFVSGSHVALKAGVRHNNLNTQAAKDIWLEKISKTTPETKYGIDLILIGTAIIMAVFTAPRILPGQFMYTRNRNYGIFARQYAYLSLRSFRI